MRKVAEQNPYKFGVYDEFTNVSNYRDIVKKEFKKLFSRIDLLYQADVNVPYLEESINKMEAELEDLEDVFRRADYFYTMNNPMA